MDAGKLCIPGERLFKSGGKYIAGVGSYVVHGHVYASLSGRLKLISSDDEKQCRVEIEHAGAQKNGAIVLPVVGDIVTCKVVGTFFRYVKCHICCIKDKVLAHHFTGAIRKEDIVAIEKHTVDIFRSFRVGDVVLARVLGFGDNASYLLSTSEEALGVAWGRCREGHKMTPISEREIKCNECGTVEPRKVAKLPTGDDDSNDR